MADASAPPISILLSRPVGKSLTEGLEIHPVHVLKPNTNRWARYEVFVTSGESARVCIWIRNTHLLETNVTVRVQAPAGLSVDARGAPGAVNEVDAGGVGRVLTWHKTLKSGEPLLGIPLDLSAGEFPMVTRPLRIQVQAGADMLAERILQVTRPLDWMMIGPFRESENDAAARMQALLAQASAAGSSPDFTSGPGSGRDGPAWIRFNSARHLGACGRIDLNAVFGQQGNCCAFAYTSIEAASSGSFPFLIENDDGIRIWVNGEEVYRNGQSVPAITSRRRVELPLIRGRNHVLVRINQVREHWQFRLSPDGTDVVQGVPLAP